MPTTTEQAYKVLRKMVLDRELEPGQRVSQRRIARRLGCSTLPIAEAMRRMESDGILVKEPRKMARVRALSARDREGLYMVREGLEAVAAQLCAQRISDPEIAELRELGRRFEESVLTNDLRGTIESEASLHRFIASCARCPLLSEELDRLLVIELTTSGETRMPEPTAYLRSHRAIIEAISNHDADLAEYLMKKHIRGGYREAVEGSTKAT